MAEYNHWNNLTEIVTMKQTYPVYRRRFDKLDINGNHPSELIATFTHLVDAEYFVKKHGNAYIGLNETTRIGRA